MSVRAKIMKKCTLEDFLGMIWRDLDLSEALTWFWPVTSQDVPVFCSDPPLCEKLIKNTTEQSFNITVIIVPIINIFVTSRWECFVLCMVATATARMEWLYTDFPRKQGCGNLGLVLSISNGEISPPVITVEYVNITSPLNATTAPRLISWPKQECCLNYYWSQVPFPPSMLPERQRKNVTARGDHHRKKDPEKLQPSSWWREWVNLNCLFQLSW